MATLTATPKRVARRLLASSFVTALATPHGVDRYLELVNPAWSVDDVRARVTDVRHLTDDTVTLTLRPNGNWRGFRAGQFVRFGVEIDGARRTRCFSPASSACRRDGRIEITAKVNPAGEVTRYLKEHARPGLVVTMSQAEGEFALPAERPQRLLLISGGSGITPVMSMLRTLCDEGHTGEVTFLHYNQTADQAPYQEELAALRSNRNVRVLRVYTEAGDGELSGRFSREHLLAAEPRYATAETYLCGPPSLTCAVEDLYRAQGVEERLHTERFTLAAPAAPASPAASGQLSFARSGAVAANDGRSLLEQAEAAGLTPEYGCRMGICFTCTTPKRSGAVRNLLTGELSDEPDEDIQLCVNAPCGDVTLDI
ncbi:MAG: 2Fe-2S iron-sulfur cluster binding domain-containing protein [Micromonosporaceae bacterium]|nr:2Fe-2S iron-sulfur cluster binding domain-containing protein [Micromonosporaceae bacterium]